MYIYMITASYETLLWD